MPHVLICGLTAADFIFGVETLPKRADKYATNTAGMVLGGGAANAALAIARQRSKASLVSRIGDDWVGKAITQILNQENIDCSFMQTCQDATSSFSSVLVDACGERQIVNFRGSGFNVLPDWLSRDTPNEFNTSTLKHNQFDAVLTDTRWIEGALAVLRMAQRYRIPGVVDAEAPISERILEIASHVAFSKQGLTAYTKIKDSEEALKKAGDQLKAWVCVTDGSNGVLHIHKGQVKHTPSYRIKAIDTLGAGDVWHGVFTLALGEGQNEQSAIDYANAAAALKCTSPGGGMAAPTKDQTLQFIKEY